MKKLFYQKGFVLIELLLVILAVTIIFAIIYFILK